MQPNSYSRLKVDSDSRLLILAANGIGDFMVYEPAVRYLSGLSLRKTLVIREDVYSLFPSLYSGFDRVLQVSLDDPDDSYESFRELTAERLVLPEPYDLVVDLFSEESFVQLAISQTTAEVLRYGPDDFLEEGKHVYSAAVHCCRNLRETFGRFEGGRDTSVSTVRFSIGASRGDLVRLIGDAALRPFVAVCPHGQNPDTRPTCKNKDIPIAQLDYVLTRLSSALPTVVLGTNRRFERSGLAASGVINLVGKTTLREAALVIESAWLVLGVDCGLLHIAGMMGKRVIGLFGPTESACWGPTDANAIIYSTFRESGQMDDLPYAQIADDLLARWSSRTDSLCVD